MIVDDDRAVARLAAVLVRDGSTTVNPPRGGGRVGFRGAPRRLSTRGRVTGAGGESRDAPGPA